MADCYTCDRYAEEIGTNTADEAIEECLESMDPPFPRTLTAMAYDADRESGDPEDGHPLYRSRDDDVTVNVAAWIREHRPSWLTCPHMLNEVRRLEE
jgi:hypothetical protein